MIAVEAESINPSNEPLNEPLTEPNISKDPVISTELDIRVLDPVIKNWLPEYLKFSRPLITVSAPVVCKIYPSLLLFKIVSIPPDVPDVPEVPGREDRFIFQEENVPDPSMYVMLTCKAPVAFV